MPNQTARLVSAVFVGILAGAPLATLSTDAARAADDCLTAPKDETPEGSHWYYRIDHATKRHCWYLREEGEKLSQSASPSSPPSAKPIAPKPETAMQRSVANAHAELPPQTIFAQPKRNDALMPAMPPDAAVGENNGVAPDAEQPQSIVGWRWLDPSAMSSAIYPRPASENLTANVPADPEAAPPPAVATAPLATADSSQVQPATIPMLLAVMTGALALAGITASVVLKLGGARRPARVRRDKIWESTGHDRSALQARPGADVLPRRTHLPRDLDRTDNADDRIAEFFSHISRRSST